MMTESPDVCGCHLPTGVSPLRLYAVSRPYSLLGAGGKSLLFRLESVSCLSPHRD